MALWRVGELVEAGKPVIEMDSELLRGRLATAEADVAAAEARVEAAKLWEGQAAEDFRRMEKMFRPADQGATPLVSEQEFTAARWTAQDASAKHKVALAEVVLARARAAEVGIEIAKTKILAPFDGKVTELFVEEGETVGVTTELCEIQETSALEVEAPIDETDFARVEPGMDARVSFDAFPGELVTGKVAKLAPKVTATREKNRTLAVTVRLPAQDRLSPGLSADVVILSKRVEDVLYLPTRCIRDGRFVYTVENGKAKRREVRLGVTNWDTTEVLDVPEGTPVVILLDLDYEGEVDGLEVTVTHSE
jgi:HlyD family secretion protein